MRGAFSEAPVPASSSASEHDRLAGCLRAVNSTDRRATTTDTQKGDATLAIWTDARPRQTVVERLLARKVCQWTVGYVIGASLLLEVTAELGDIWNWPVRVGQIVSLVLGIGLFPACIVSWYHGEKGRQRMCAGELALLAALLLAGAALMRATL